MDIITISIASGWGAIFGLLAIHALANLLASLFCLHGLLLTRWKRLAHQAASGCVKYAINLRLLLRLSLYCLLFCGLLYYGDNFIHKQFRFDYRGSGATIFISIAAVSAFSRLKAMGKRLQVIWRMSHDVDYAERRQRTQMLKG